MRTALKFTTIARLEIWPLMDKFLWKNVVLMWLSRLGYYGKTTPNVPFAIKALSERLQTEKQQSGPMLEKSQSEKRKVDLLDKFLRAKKEFPDTVDDKAVLGLSLSMVNAGSDTTATTIAAIFYYLLKNPTTMARLRKEIEERFPPPAEDAGRTLESCVTSFSEAQKLPYLDACIKETLRYHPALGGQLQERLVPPGGATISGEWIPEGTIVSCCTWLVHRHKPTFGNDSDQFRPERWLEASEEQLSAMNRALTAFGAGPHTCVGKNIAILEINKLVPSILRAYDVSLFESLALNTVIDVWTKVELKDPSVKWKILNLGFVETYDFFVCFKRRF